MSNNSTKRETFNSNFGLLMTFIGVAVGLGNIWRFPYMVGKFGGAGFVFIYLLSALLIGVPAMMAELTLGRYTRRGPLGAFHLAGFPGGKYIGYFFFFVVIVATSYYVNAVGWVGYYGIAEIGRIFGIEISATSILPPATGIDANSLVLQFIASGCVILGCSFVLVKGLRSGIERVSKIIVPILFIILITLIIRSSTLPGASEGIDWFIGSFDFNEMNANTIAAALGQAIFSLSLGGTFMVIYGSYLKKETPIPRTSIYIVIGDTLVGILAGFAIFPAVFAFGLEPGQGPGLIFSTLPSVFQQMPMGSLFGTLFFVGLFGAAFLSAVAAFEVIIGGMVDYYKWNRKKAVIRIGFSVFILAIPTMLNEWIFTLVDLVFGSGMQTLGALLSVITVVYCINRAEALKQLSAEGKPFSLILFWWMRIVIPLAIIVVGVNWIIDNLQ